MTFNSDPTPSSEDFTLRAVKSQFAQWRSTRSKGTRIPDSLWYAVERLTKSYNHQQICSELKINSRQLCKKMKVLPEESSLPASSHFIQVSLPPLSPSSSEPNILEQKGFHPPLYTGSIELIRVDGAILKASGVDNNALCSLVQNFLRQ